MRLIGSNIKGNDGKILGSAAELMLKESSNNEHPRPMPSETIFPSVLEQRSTLKQLKSSFPGL